MAAAAPTVYPFGQCPLPTYSYTASAGPVFWDAPVLNVAPQTCGSTSGTICSIGKSESVSNGVTITEGGSLALDL